VSSAHDIPDGLWDRLRADPRRAPEHIALAAAERHAPAAAAWAAEKRGRLGVGDRELARMAKRRHAALARVEGAATGVGGFLTVVPDMVLLAWIQSRLVFFVAAAHGFDPHDPMRPAELLVLRDLYPDPQTARSALDGVGRTVAEAYVGDRLDRGREQAMLSRLLRFVGKRTASRAARRLIPGVAIAFNAVANERDTRALADKAIRFYGG
jgi:EcsC protein family